jgi:hypothetical protein
VTIASPIAPHDLLEASEDYELALSRLAWAKDCGCQMAGEQAAAIAWLCRQCDESLTAMTELGGHIAIEGLSRS